MLRYQPSEILADKRYKTEQCLKDLLVNSSNYSGGHRSELVFAMLIMSLDEAMKSMLQKSPDN